MASAVWGNSWLFLIRWDFVVKVICKKKNKKVSQCSDSCDYMYCSLVFWKYRVWKLIAIILLATVNIFNLIMLMICELFIGTVYPVLSESCESPLKPVLLTVWRLTTHIWVVPHR